MNFSIITLGHSKGGAVAQILATYLHEESGFKNMKVLTFASPMVFDREAKQIYDEILGLKTLHIIERTDLITILPPSSFGYERTGKILCS